MARPLRIEYPGAVYHVTSRGDARRKIFMDDTDRQQFLTILASTIGKYNWLCHAYCLMDNHYHLLEKGSLEKGSCNITEGNAEWGLRSGSHQEILS